MRASSASIFNLLLLSWLVLFPTQAHALIENADVLDDILTRYKDAASAWAGVITDRASWLFWLLVVISMVWTFGLMAVRRADLGEFFAEFIRFTVFTGFFWWLLINGPNFSTSIIASLKQIGAEASGLRGMGSPSSIVDIGFDLFYRSIDEVSYRSPIVSMTGIIVSAAILIILALISVNMALLLVSGWILAYAGVFFLGFGGSRWTSDIAINYYRTVLGVAVSLLAMILLVGIGKTFLDDYYLRMSGGLNLKELSVMMVASIVLFALVNKIPPMLAGIVGGGGGGIGNIGAGAAIGTAAAATGMAAGMMMASATHAAGGASAIKAAFDAAHDTMSSGGGMSTGLGGSPSGGGSGRSGGGLGQAMGTGARFAANMGSNLAKGSMAVAKAGAGDRVSQTPGGKIASAIRASMEQPEFTGNRFANSTDTTVDREAETEAFVNSKR
ncbi:type IV secretion system protein VirB6/type IV secretion system protein TrbL [Nitrosospira sp. Nsp11]|uniref:P-type conjugative transfer protein TrbL n=1 Tax=Nitrosospira sp. Nsp11 TaxID=1855338 RepID=UPI000916798A|nr:P-type conjugative transfer protein TrbL [Nitrosospira sp. Nsp11]SHM14453.1 type IV secretion system protein VirB6/type IV secretion system protein TrbL [Nitrosospira sp. Nsp11]